MASTKDVLDRLSFANTGSAAVFSEISSGCTPFIPVMQTTNFSKLNDPTNCRQLYWSCIRCVFFDG